MKRLFPHLDAVALSLDACTSLRTSLPLTGQPPQPPLSSSFFSGHAQAARIVAGSWQPDCLRKPSNSIPGATGRRSRP
jgi:hypothetical protein